MTSSITESANHAVQALVDAQVSEGRQIGVQVAAYVAGEPFVDAVAGTMGPGDARPVQPDSLFLSFSSTKGPAALVVHQLAERGLLHYDVPVAQYWPAFAANGKQDITVAQAMSHQGGLHAMPEPFAPEHITDWQAGIARIEQATPAWTPGTATGYHAVTYGWIVGGLVAAITGRHFSDVLRTEIAEPLGIADEFYVGTPDDHSLVDRFVTLNIVAAGDGLPIPDDSPFYQAMPKAMWPHFNTLAFRQACLPSGNGHFTARALARMYAALANGGEIDGVRPVEADRVASMQKLQTDEVDQVLGTPIRKNTGFLLGGLGPDAHGGMVHGPLGPDEAVFGHSGAGGSVGFADPNSGLGLAVTVNKMAYPEPGSGATLEICDLVRSLL